MSIAVERVQNYFQYQDAEAKYYSLLKNEAQDVVKEEVKVVTEQVSQESKSKKSKKNNKKKDSSENVSAAPVEAAPAQAKEPKKKTKSVSKDDTEDVSVKTDSGIVDEPASEASAAKKKSKSKKQREKKAAAVAAAQQQQESAESPKEPQTKEKIVIDLTPAAVAQATPVAAPVAAAAKPKDKKKKPKNSSTEPKPKESNDKNGVSCSGTSNLVSEIAKARQHIKSSLERVDGASALNGSGGELMDRISSLEKDNSSLRGVVDGLQKLVISLEGRLNKLEGGSSTSKPTPAASKPAPADDDDDVDLFGSDEEDDEAAEQLKAERVKAYTAKKSTKAALIAKSSILLDVKPWDDETDMGAMEKQVRTIVMDGLLWGVSKLVPLAYGIMKLQILCIIEDDKVSVDELQEKICEFEDFVQSVDIAAFNKI